MNLWLTRHGIAVSRDDPGCPLDPERPLTERGRARTERAARGLQRLGVQPDLILSSHLVRAIQTAEVIAEVLGYPGERIERTEALDIDADPDELFDLLRGRPEQRVLCCGHAPNLDWILSACLEDLDGINPLKKCGTACVQLPEGVGRPGVVEWVRTPRELRALVNKE